MKRKSTFSVLFFLRTDQPKKNGEVAIRVRITIDSLTSTFNTNLFVQPADWNKKTAKAVVNRKRNNTEVVSRINRSLESLRVKIRQLYDRYCHEQGFALPEDIKNSILGTEEKKKTVSFYCNEYITLKSKKVGISLGDKAFHRYEVTRDRFFEYIKLRYKKTDLYLKDLTPDMIDGFYMFFRQYYNIKHNTALKYMQRFESILTFTKNKGEVFSDPFVSFQYRYEKVDRDFLVLEEIETLMEKSFKTKRLAQVRDIFVFSCFTGLAYTDLESLSMQHIKTSFDGTLWIDKKRVKTGVDSKIKLMDIPRSILEKYIGKKIEKEDLENPSDKKVLPVITNQKMNEYLEEIATICGINKELTCHTARHTFATLCLTMGTPIESVSKMLGHTSISTTQIYARVIDRKLSHDMSKLEQALRGKNIVNVYK
ncbi:MAG: site-specific integrase [Tannerellaceae bacterium]|nr:site-specific integrase [Tannerellaceae bacterium]